MKRWSPQSERSESKPAELPEPPTPGSPTTAEELFNAASSADQAEIVSARAPDVPPRIIRADMSGIAEEFHEGDVVQFPTDRRQ
jgi:hypothetical protein